MTIVTDFDSTRFYLGSLCKRNHDFKEGKSLRALKGKNCLECKREKWKEWLQANIERRRAYRAKHHVLNREYDNQRNADWYQSNKDKVRKRQSKYRKTLAGKVVTRRKNYKRRILKYSSHRVRITKKETEARFQEFNNCCAYCEINVASTLDHLIALASGGADCLGNLIPACKKCNSSKAHIDSFEWYSKQSFFSQKRWRRILKVLGKAQATYTQIPLF